MAVGQTDELDGKLAAEEILSRCTEGLDGHQPQAALLHASHDLDVDVFLSEITSAYPDLALIGCSAIAAMSSSGDFVEGCTTLTLFASDTVDFTVGLGRDIANDVGAAVRQAIQDATSKTTKTPALMIVTPSVEGFDPADVAKHIGQELGDVVPVIGGGAAPDLPVASPWLGGMQFYGNEILTDTVPVLLLSGPLKVSVGVAHGWSTVGKSAVVTRSEHDTVHEIDGESILDFYRRYIGTGSNPAIAHPLAVLDPETGEYYLRAPFKYDQDDGSVTFFGSVPEGSTVQLAMATTDEILRGAEASVAQALEAFPGDEAPEAALVASCSVRTFLLGTRTRDEIARIRAGLGGELPVSGFYGVGEIAPLGVGTPPSFHNETCVTVLLGS